jgi:phosphate:Na+ symporter
VYLLATDSLHVAEISMGLLGGLALFLYGMHRMADGLKAAAGEGMKRLLARLTSNRFTAAATGAIVTAVIQSSSVTTVLVVGFVSAGLMSLSQSVGVIMGANVGTTITAQIVAFKVTKYAWLMIALGFAMNSIAKRSQYRHYGLMILGLGLLFVGMEQMSVATNPLRTYDPFIELMQKMGNPLWGILLGAVFTAVVQSSSATTGIVIMLASQGFLSLEGGIALTIGANIGTCFTAVLSAIGKPTEAVRVAVVHVLFNVIGALLWLQYIPELAEIARSISPSAAQLEGTAQLAADTPRQVANANTIFNVANTLILIWLAGPIAWLAARMVPERPKKATKHIEPKFLDPVYLSTPSLALDRVRMELGRMGQIVERMLARGAQVVISGSHEELAELVSMDHDVDRLHVAILEYARELGRGELTVADTTRIEDLIYAANHVETMGDLVKTNLVTQGLHRLEQNLQFSSQTQEIVRPLSDCISQAATDALRAFATEDVELARTVVTMKPEVKRLAQEAVDHLGARLLADEPNRVELFRIETEIISHMKRIFDNARRIAQRVAKRAKSAKGE